MSKIILMRKNVSVIARMDISGKVTPLFLIWENGKIYEIDKVLDIRKKASTKGGGMGLRYLCKFGNHERYLWLDEYIWFVEL